MKTWQSWGLETSSRIDRFCLPIPIDSITIVESPCCPCSFHSFQGSWDSSVDQTSAARLLIAGSRQCGQGREGGGGTKPTPFKKYKGRYKGRCPTSIAQHVTRYFTKYWMKYLTRYFTVLQIVVLSGAALLSWVLVAEPGHLGNCGDAMSTWRVLLICG